MKFIGHHKNWPHFYWSTEDLLPLLASARKRQGIMLAYAAVTEVNPFDRESKEDLVRPLVRERLLLWNQSKEFRAQPVRSGVDPVYIPAEINRLIRWFNGNSQNRDGLLRAAIAYIWLISVSPFTEGNENVALRLMDLALAQEEKTATRYYQISDVTSEDRQGYQQILQQTQNGDLNIQPWLKWFLRTYINVVDQSIEVFQHNFKKIEYWKAWQKKPLNSRQRHVLQTLLEGSFHAITNRKYVSLVQTSPESAKRDLVDLTQKDILVRSTALGRSTSYSLKKI